MRTKDIQPLGESQTFYVDIPTEDCINDDSGAWHNVGQFDTEAAALAFAKEHFGADVRGRVFLVPSQMDERRDKLELAATDMVGVLRAEITALRIWQSAKGPRGHLALPDDVWDGMTISIDKIDGVLRRAGVDEHCEQDKCGAIRRNSGRWRNKHGRQCRR
jgi:hypothetical protein